MYVEERTWEAVWEGKREGEGGWVDVQERRTEGNVRVYGGEENLRLGVSVMGMAGEWKCGEVCPVDGEEEEVVGEQEEGRVW